VGSFGWRGLARSALRPFRRHAEFPAHGAAVPEAIPASVGRTYRAMLVTDAAFYRQAHDRAPGDTPDGVTAGAWRGWVAGRAQVIAGLAADQDLGRR